jgi:hypothetical protein
MNSLFWKQIGDNVNSLSDSLTKMYAQRKEDEFNQSIAQAMQPKPTQVERPVQAPSAQPTPNFSGMIGRDVPTSQLPAGAMNPSAQAPLFSPTQTENVQPSNMEAFRNVIMKNPSLLGTQNAQRNLQAMQLFAPTHEMVQPGSTEITRDFTGNVTNSRQFGQKLPNTTDEQYVQAYKKQHPEATDIDAIDALNKSKIGNAAQKADALQGVKIGKNYLPKNVIEGRAWAEQAEDQTEKDRRTRIVDVMEKQAQTNSDYSQKAKLEGTTENGDTVTFKNNRLWVTDKNTGQSVVYDPKVHKNIHLIGEASQIATAKERGIAYAYGRALYNQNFVLDTEDGTVTNVNNLELAQHPGRYVDLANGQKIMKPASMVEDIRGNINQTRKAVKALDNNFDESFKADLALALRQSDPSSAISKLISSIGPDKMSPSQLDFLNSLNFLTENAMAMRTILGAGQGSDDLRSAITNTLPGVMSPNKEYAQKQLDLFEKTLDRLKRGIPTAKGGKAILSGENQGGQNPQPTQIAPEDQEAIDWAKANPNDPRAQQILKLHGIK